MSVPLVVCLGQFTIDDVVRWDGLVRMGAVGGDAVYSWLGAHLWADQVGIVAPIGDDFPTEALGALHSAGGSLDGVVTRHVPTIRNWVLYEEDGRRSWVMRSDPANSYLLSPGFADIPEPYRGARAFHIAAMDLRAQAELLDALRRAGVLLAFDPQEDYIPGNEPRFLQMLRHIDLFLPSGIEVRQLVGHVDYARAAREIAAEGPRVVAVKLGAEGAFVFERETGHHLHVPAYPARVVDETGAGDAFCGGFVAAVVQGHSVFEAAARAIVSASFVVQTAGWLSALQFSRADAEERLRDYRSSVFPGRSASVP